MNHFCKRAVERGVKCCPAMLYEDLKLAWEMKRDDFLEHVFESEGRDIYRFSVGGDIFYAPFTAEGVPVTVLTQAMFKAHRAARKYGISPTSADKAMRMWGIMDHEKKAKQVKRAFRNRGGA